MECQYMHIDAATIGLLCFQVRQIDYSTRIPSTFWKPRGSLLPRRPRSPR
jgi:hypothetical protein